MLVKNTLRTIEKTWLRPLGHALKRALGGSPFGGGRRIARLERRVEELEGLVRELTGLAYLRLADDDAIRADHDRTAA
jgi:hypothetical protein